MSRVRFITDPFDLGTWVEKATLDVPATLRQQFPVWPENARLYRGAVSSETECTPQAEEDIEALSVEDDYYVVVWPGDPVTAIVTAIAVLALTVAILLFMQPALPGSSAQESSNNSLGNRTNKARPNGRIPDIYGQVISIPELLTVPLLRFEDNLEVETCFMCVGRGEHEITDVRDGDTPLILTAGAGASIYGPNTSPNFGAPQLVVGTPVDAPLVDVVRLNEVNGQLLEAPNANAVSGDNNIRFVAPNIIQNDGDIDFTEFFGPGDAITVTGASFGGSTVVFDATTQQARFYPDKRIEFSSFDPTTLYAAGQTLVIQNAGFAGVDALGAVVYVDVSGTYIIASVSATQIQLVP